jgi:hypothetical protein
MDDFKQRVQESRILEILRNALPEKDRKSFDEIAAKKIQEWEEIYKDVNNVIIAPKGEQHVEQPEGQSRSDEEST